MTIKTKIFAAILSANLLLALCMYLVSSWTFQNGFLDYVNRFELTQLDRLSAKLIDIYEKEGSWQILKTDRRLWRTLLQEQSQQPSFQRDNSLLRPTPDKFREESRRDREPILLFDENKKLLLGFRKPEAELLYQPLTLNNKVIGYLAIEKRIQLAYNLDQAFAQQQVAAYGWIALGSVFISILIAFPFASRIIKPLRALLDSTQALAKGLYQSRVAVFSKDEIGKLGLAFNDMADNIEQHQKQQQQWIADISHELRTPLSVLKAEVEAMQDGIRPIDNNSINSLHQEINYLSRLVGDLHELSKEDSKTLSYHKASTHVEDIIKEAIDSFSQELEEKKLTIKLQTDTVPNIQADQDRMMQLFVNLLQNNCRYCPENATISVTIKSKNNCVEILWEDSGYGVNNENLGKLFDRLFREDKSRSQYQKGSGLGLSISKSIVESHKGSISAFHSALGGLGIKISLPSIAIDVKSETPNEISNHDRK